MVRFRSRSRGLSLRPVNRIKHVVDNQQGVALGVVGFKTVILASDTPDLANTVEVQTGATVNGIYLKAEVSMTSGTSLANVYLMVAKNPGGNLSLPVPNVVGVSDNKRFVIHQEMVMMQKFDADVASNPRILFNGVIVIPKGYRRFGPNDKLDVHVLSPGGNIDFCLQCHYKEFR